MYQRLHIANTKHFFFFQNQNPKPWSTLNCNLSHHTVTITKHYDYIDCTCHQNKTNVQKQWPWDCENPHRIYLVCHHPQPDGFVSPLFCQVEPSPPNRDIEMQTATSLHRHWQRSPIFALPLVAPHGTLSEERALHKAQIKAPRFCYFCTL